MDFSDFAGIPVQHEGRVKPLDSFARAALLTINGKDSLEDISATEWLAELLLQNKEALKREVFHIPNPDVVRALRLGERQSRHYSFLELANSLGKNAQLLAILGITQQDSMSLAQRQLLELQEKILFYFNISQTFSAILPGISVKNREIAKELRLPVAKDITYFELAKHRDRLIKMLESAVGKKPEQLTDMDREVFELSQALQLISAAGSSPLLRIVPPQWKEAGDEWSSPLSTLQEGRGSPGSAEYLDLWKKLAEAYKQKNAPEWNQTARQLSEKIYGISSGGIDESRISLEVAYNKFKPFKISLALYFIAFLMYLAGLLSGKEKINRYGFYLLAVSAVVHFSGIAMRVYILGRPPVSTLYESIVFVALIGVLFSIYLECKRKDGIGVLAGALLGTVLQFIGTMYAADGDTLGMLVAVLNTNFWLATHVVAITTGYGFCLITSLLGHIYLIKNLLRPGDRKNLVSLEQTILGSALISLLFTMLGTILGGIWADQSWGRFWGWDPKENGAMLITLWLIWLLHGKISGVLNSYNFVLGTVFTSVIVALAWFGVNLLSVGLHSYGFTENIELNLYLFCGGEIGFIMFMYFWPLTRKSRQ